MNLTLYTVQKNELLHMIFVAKRIKIKKFPYKPWIFVFYEEK